MLGPPTVFTVINDTVPLQASAGATGVPTVLDGGAPVTIMVLDAQAVLLGQPGSSILT